MLKMIKTDWLAIKAHHWRLLLLAVIVIFCGFAGMSIVIIPLSAYGAVAFSMTVFSVEEKGKLDHLYLTLPISRRSIVTGRFAFVMTLLIATFTICGLVVWLSSLVLAFGEFSVAVQPELIALMSFVGFAFGAFINMCMYPVMFKIGYEKGKIFGFYIPLTIVAVVMALFGSLINVNLETIMYLTEYSFENTVKVCGILFVIGLALFALSYMLSLWLYSKRDI